MGPDDLVARWLDGLNRGDLPGLLELFAPEPRIRNAAHPPVQGPDAARDHLRGFFERTASRRFDLIDLAVVDDQIFAAWRGTIVFAKGAQMGPNTPRRPVEIELRGVDWLRLDDRGKIAELEVVHETIRWPAP
jgi:hypothetical protein